MTKDLKMSSFVAIRNNMSIKVGFVIQSDNFGQMNKEIKINLQK